MSRPITFLLLFAVVAMIGVGCSSAVTQPQKQSFMSLLRSLPSRGEFYTAESVGRTAPFVPVLFSLTNDIAEGDLFQLAALSRGLCDRADVRKYATSHFSDIAHPTLRMFWAAAFVADYQASADMNAYLARMIESPEGLALLQELAGPRARLIIDRVTQAPQKETGRTIESR